MNGVRRAVAGQVLRDAAAQIRREVLNRPARTPWMKHREIDVLTELVGALGPRRCLEWGAGYSTLYFPRLIPEGATWTSIEHVGEWAEAVRRRRPEPNTRVLHVPRDLPPEPNEPHEGSYESFKSYVDAAGPLAPLDLILVDGRARMACIRKSLEVLAPGGLVVLHDAHRPKYAEAPALFPKRLSFTDYRTRSGGLLIGSRDREPRDLVDADRHLAIWDVYRRMARF